MKTITFYSYKGGVGRSLLVANAATYLSTLGKSVFAIDFDLEAPGLHYKFELAPGTLPKECSSGLVDVLTTFIDEKRVPRSLLDFSEKLAVPREAGAIHLMGAGTAPRGDYWRKLARINWHDLFYAPDAAGVLFFFELKERIQQEFSPDFLLIDARTGITEMGGVATTLLADIVVCLALSSREHLEGLRAVMHGIRRTADHEREIDIVPVISRLPLQSNDTESADLDRVREFLNEPIGETPTSLALRDIAVLHAEPVLAAGEQILVGGPTSPYELPLLRDYLRLFSRIIPADDIRLHVGQLIQRATTRLLDDPEGAQSNLEALTAYCADADAYRALLKVYRLRKAPLEKLAAAADLMRQMGVSATDPLLSEVVKQIFGDPRAYEIQKKYTELGEAVWLASGGTDPGMALTLASVYFADRRERALKILHSYVERVEPPAVVVLARLIDFLRISSMPDEAFSVVDRFKTSASAAPQFIGAWGRLIADVGDLKLAREFLKDPLFRLEVLRVDEPGLFYRLRKRAVDERSPGLLSELLAEQLTAGSQGNLRELADIFQEENRMDEFELSVRARLPQNMVDDLLENTRRRNRRAHRGAF